MSKVLVDLDNTKTVNLHKNYTTQSRCQFKEGVQSVQFLFSTGNNTNSEPAQVHTLYRRDRAGDGSPHPHFFGWQFFFYFGYPDLSLTTQTRFSNLTILNTHKQRTDKLCLVAVANEFVALNDNRKGNFGTFRESDLKMSKWHSTVECVGFGFKVYSFKFLSNVGARDPFLESPDN